MLELVANVHAFFDRLKVSGIEIYNEFSLQHELPGNCNGQGIHRQCFQPR